MRLLPAYDEYLLGWRSRDPGYRSAGGVIRSAVLVGGRVVGTWRGRGKTLAVEAYEPLSDVVRAGIAEEIADIERFL
ncbi:DNA glycosylase AlkZ-like family protein [Kutzneria kofuensis]|uniref:DNA glycosylase AlkZ-like family protein n=1 Tax=Kutzneria kofuensis TaxID=103725 RepID=UPI0031E748F7